MQKNRLSLHEGALNPINVGLPVNVSFYPLLAMQSSAGGNAVGAFAAGWARYIFENILIFIFYILIYLFIFTKYVFPLRIITLLMK